MAKPCAKKSMKPLEEKNEKMMKTSKKAPIDKMAKQVKKGIKKDK